MSTETVDTSLWQHIHKLRPEIQAHIKIYSHFYRKERWYILHDVSSGQYLRFNERAYSIIGRLDGRLSLDEILEYTQEHYYDISTDEIVALIGQLNAAEVLKVGLPADAQDIFRQYKAQKSKQKRTALMNPLSIKIPLFHPEKILHTLAPIARLLFSKVGLVFWILTISLALILALANAEALVHDINALSLSPTQLIIFWLIYPFVKAIHELGHGLALKIWDGEVPEVGVNILLLMPVPYVDATSSIGFQNKWRRITVGAAGMIFELFLAALCLFLWLLVEPGLIKDISLNIILLASLSTLLFNGNPLLRYDGYFILEDYLEIPNLATRSKRYYYYLIQKYFLKIKEALSPVTAFGEEKWFLFYGFFSPLYRLIILFTIAIYLSESFLFIGVALALWAVLMQVIIPLAKALSFLFYNKNTLHHRKQSIKLILSSSILLILTLLIPVPSTTYTQGIVSTLGKAEVKTEISGFVVKLNTPSGEQVKKGQALLTLENADLQASYKTLQAKVKELDAKIGEQQSKSRVRAQIYQDDLHAVKSELALVRSEIAALTLYAQSDGEFVFAHDKNYLGHFIQQGEVIAYIINPKQLIIKALVSQSHIGLIQSYKTSAQVELNDIKHTIVDAKIIPRAPQSITILPSLALSSNAGGAFITEPKDTRGLSLQKPMFQIDLSLAKDSNFHYINSKVNVRFEHGSIPIAKQIIFQTNQVFLRHFY